MIACVAEVANIGDHADRVDLRTAAPAAHTRHLMDGFSFAVVDATMTRKY
jgi:hypothetical protein